MGSRLFDYKFGDISGFKYGKMPKKDKKVEEGYPIFTGYRISGYYTEYMYENPQLVIVARGVGGTGDVKLAPSYSYITNLSIIIEPNANIADQYYLMYYLNSLKLRYLDSGSAQSQITINDLGNLKVTLPSLEIQKEVANLLRTYDKKIQLNNQIIFNLEQLAQTLFKRWFVDFEFPDENGEPYKWSGGEMVEGELGMIPEGWKSGRLTDIATLIMGQSPKSDTYNEDGLGLPLINGASDFKKDQINPLKYTTDPKRESKEGDFIFGVRATVGNVTYVDKEYALGRGVGIARAKKNEYREMLYFQLITGINHLKSTATGSVYISFTKSDIEGIKVIIPNTNVVKLFHGTVKSFLEQKNTLIIQNDKLVNLRDMLLPKLLSGEIEIPDENEVNSDVSIP